MQSPLDGHHDAVGYFKDIAVIYDADKSLNEESEDMEKSWILVEKLGFDVASHNSPTKTAIRWPYTVITDVETELPHHTCLMNLVSLAAPMSTMVKTTVHMGIEEHAHERRGSHSSRKWDKQMKGDVGVMMTIMIMRWPVFPRDFSWLSVVLALGLVMTFHAQGRFYTNWLLGSADKNCTSLSSAMFASRTTSILSEI